jgi:hypothetical protein
MSFHSTFGSFESSGFAGLGDLGAAKKKAKKPRKIGPLRAWKRKNGIRGARAKAVLVKKSKDGKTCDIQLTFANPKGGKDLVFKHTLKKAPFRPFAKLCKKCKAGATYTGGAAEAADANSEAESTEAAAVESGEAEAAGEESDEQEMEDFGAFWQAPAGYYQVGRLNPAYSGGYGAAPTGRKLRYTRDQAIAKFKRFRDEDAQLKVAYETHNTKLATETLARLARLRDHFYTKAANAAQGKATGQVTGRVILGLATSGLSELVRATGALKGKVGADRAKRAEHFLALGDACEAVFRYWKGKLGEGHRSGKKPVPAALVAKIRNLAVAGKTQAMPVEEGEDVEQLASGISYEVATNISSQIQTRGQPEFQPLRPGPSSMRQGPGRGRPQAPRGPRSKMYMREEIQSGVPAEQSEFSWQGLGAIALGAFGGLLIAPRIGL